MLEPAGPRASYLFNATIAGIDAADALLIVGTNPRKEAPVLNARIRKRWRTGSFTIGVIGRRRRSDLPTTTISAPAPRRSPTSPPASIPSPTLVKARQRPAIVIGRRRALARADGAAVLSLAAKARRRSRRRQGRLERLYRAAHRGRRGSARSISASCPGRAASTPRQMATSATLDVLFLLGADEIDIAAGRLRRLSSAPMATRRAPRRRDPAGRRLHREDRHSTSTPRAGCRWPTAPSFPPGEAREDWAILRALSDVLGKQAALRLARRAARRRSSRPYPHLMRIDQIAPGDAGRRPGARGQARRHVDKAPFGIPVEDFYLTNPIARASAVMAECSRAGLRRAS